MKGLLKAGAIVLALAIVLAWGSQAYADPWHHGHDGHFGHGHHGGYWHSYYRPRVFLELNLLPYRGYYGGYGGGYYGPGYYPGSYYPGNYSYPGYYGGYSGCY